MSALAITVFADFSCPFSYVTESALRSVQRPGTEIVYRAFELFPEPEPLDPPVLEGEVRQALDELAAAAGIALTPPDFRPRTTKAHEASRFARDREHETDLRTRIYSAYWSEGRDIGRIDVLMDLAARSGMDPEELKIALDIDRFTDEIAHDREVARRLRIPGTPTIFIGSGQRARVIAGAHGRAELVAAVEEYLRSWQDVTDDV